MTAILGVILIMFGGLASGAFYLPLKYVKNWSWETGWLIQGISAWVLAPWIIAMITVPSLFSIIGQSPSNESYLVIDKIIDSAEKNINMKRIEAMCHFYGKPLPSQLQEAPHFLL